MKRRVSHYTFFSTSLTYTHTDWNNTTISPTTHSENAIPTDTITYVINCSYPSGDLLHMMHANFIMSEDIVVSNGGGLSADAVQTEKLHMFSS